MRSLFTNLLPISACLALSGCLTPPITSAPTATQKRAASVRNTPFFSRNSVKIIGTSLGATLGITIAVLSYTHSKENSPLLSFPDENEAVDDKPDPAVERFVRFHQIEKAHDHWVLSIASKKEGTCVASGTKEAVTIWEFDPDKKYPLKAIKRKKRNKTPAFCPVAFHPKSNCLAYASKEKQEVSLTILDLEEDTQKSYKEAHKNPIQAIAWHPSGDFLATASTSNPVQMYTTRNKPYKLTAPLEDPSADNYDIAALAYHPIKNLLALGTGSQSKYVIVWDVDTHTQHVLTNIEETDNALALHKGWICAVTWSPDGTRLVSADSYGTIRVWGTESHKLTEWRCLYSLQHCGKNTMPFAKGVPSLSISEDGKYLASAGKDGTVKLWALPTRATTPYQVLHGHKGYVLSVAFHGHYLLSAGKDKSIIIWERTQQEAAVEVEDE